MIRVSDVGDRQRMEFPDSVAGSGASGVRWAGWVGWVLWEGGCEACESLNWIGFVVSSGFKCVSLDFY